MEYEKGLHDSAHPLVGQVFPTKRWKLRRSSLDCPKEIVLTPQKERLKRWKL